MGRLVRSRSQARSSHVEQVAEHGGPAEHLLAQRGVLRQRRVERRVGEVVGDARPGQERQVGSVEVGGPPAHHEGVQGDHERPEAGRLGPGHQRGRHLALGRPVELVPARPGARRLGHLLDRIGRGGGVDEREAQARGRAPRPARRRGGRWSAPRWGPAARAPACPCPAPTWTRPARPRPAACGGRCRQRSNARRLAGGGTAARAPRHVAEGLGHHRLPGRVLQPGQVGGERRPLAGRPPQVDLALEVAEGRGSHAANLPAGAAVG